MGQDPDKQVAWVVIRFGVVVSALVEGLKRSACWQGFEALEISSDCLTDRAGGRTALEGLERVHVRGGHEKGWVDQVQQYL